MSAKIETVWYAYCDECCETGVHVDSPEEAREQAAEHDRLNHEATL